MSVIEVCDICKKEVKKYNGITVKAYDTHPGPKDDRQTNFDIRICSDCKNNIIKYCKKKKVSIVSKFLEQFSSDFQENN